MKDRVSVVLSLVALAVSLLALTQRGTAGVRASLPPRSVGTAQLEDGAVTAAKVRAHSLVKRNFKQGQLPAGRRGPQGLPGPAGPTGPTGPSDGYAASLVGPAPVAVQATPATIAELEIPQGGSYVIGAKAYFDSTGSGIATIACTLDTLAGDVDAVQLLAGSPTPVELSVVHVYPGPGAVDLRCAARAAAEAHYVRITAIRVGTLRSTSVRQATR
jgi:hypothetical protein